MSRFVMPETVRLPLSGGDYLEVKKQLNVSEQKQLESCGIKRSMVGKPEVDWEQYHIGRAAIWITGWGGPGFSVDGVSKVFSLDALKSLDTDTFDEIQTALNKHKLEIDEAKKAKTSVAMA